MTKTNIAILQGLMLCHGSSSCFDRLLANSLFKLDSVLWNEQVGCIEGKGRGVKYAYVCWFL